MKLVIDTDEDLYVHIKNSYIVCEETLTGKSSLGAVYNAIANGKPLSKGHGELVYREDICNELRYMDNNGYITRSVNHVIEDIKKGVPTIIEADNKYEAKAITRGNCMMCGKELTEGLFFCKECEGKGKE